MSVQVMTKGHRAYRVEGCREAAACVGAPFGSSRFSVTRALEGYGDLGPTDSLGAAMRVSSTIATVDNRSRPVFTIKGVGSAGGVVGAGGAGGAAEGVGGAAEGVGGGEGVGGARGGGMRGAVGSGGPSLRFTAWPDQAIVAGELTEGVWCADVMRGTERVGEGRGRGSAVRLGGPSSGFTAGPDHARFCSCGGSGARSHPLVGGSGGVATGAVKFTEETGAAVRLRAGAGLLIGTAMLTATAAEGFGALLASSALELYPNQNTVACARVACGNCGCSRRFDWW